MNIRKYAILLTVLTFIIMTGCNINSKTDTEYSKFKDSYLKATEFTELGNDYLVAVNKMDSELIEEELEKMNKQIDAIQSESDYAIGIKENLVIYYDSLNFLLYAHKNYDRLTIEEKQRVYTESSIVTDARDDFTNGEE